MPYVNNKNFDFTDIVKQGIINLYLEDSIPSNNYCLNFADILPHSGTESYLPPDSLHDREQTFR